MKKLINFFLLTPFGKNQNYATASLPDEQLRNRRSVLSEFVFRCFFGMIRQVPITIMDEPNKVVTVIMRSVIKTLNDAAHEANRNASQCAGVDDTADCYYQGLRNGYIQAAKLLQQKYASVLDGEAGHGPASMLTFSAEDKRILEGFGIKLDPTD